MERESHEMKSPSDFSTAWVLNNSEHFVRSDKICIEGTFFTRKTSPFSADESGSREAAG